MDRVLPVRDDKPAVPDFPDPRHHPLPPVVPHPQPQPEQRERPLYERGEADEGDEGEEGEEGDEQQHQQQHQQQREGEQPGTTPHTHRPHTAKHPTPPREHYNTSETNEPDATPHQQDTHQQDTHQHADAKHANGDAQDDGRITLSVRDQNSNQYMFMLRRTTPFRKIFMAFADKVREDVSRYRFHFDGARLAADDTPARMEMVEGDVLDAFLESEGGRPPPTPTPCCTPPFTTPQPCRLAGHQTSCIL